MLLQKKNASVVAVAAILSLPAIMFAAPITLPYQTNFSTTPDSNGNTYTGGGAALQGQAPGTGTGTTGWVNENGEQNDTATVANSASNGTVTLTSTYNAPVAGVPTWSDVYNSNLADHPAAPGNGNGLALNTTPYGNQLSISYSLNVLSGTGSLNANSSPESASGFGVRVLDSSDNLLAALFVKGNASGTPGEEDIYTQSGTDGAKITPLVGPANGVIGNYTIALDLQHGDFNVFVNGVESADIPFGTGETSITSIGGIAFSTDNLGGGNQGIFGNFSVVPEPASIGMIGLGGLALLFRRPKRPA